MSIVLRQSRSKGVVQIWTYLQISNNIFKILNKNVIFLFKFKNIFDKIIL